MMSSGDDGPDRADRSGDPQGETSEATQIGEEAAEWLLNFDPRALEPDDPFHDPAVRDAAFLKWVTTSPDHLLLFFETVEVKRRFGRIDPSVRARIREAVEGAQRAGDLRSLVGSRFIFSAEGGRYFIGTVVVSELHLRVLAHRWIPAGPDVTDGKGQAARSSPERTFFQRDIQAVHFVFDPPNSGSEE